MEISKDAMAAKKVSPAYQSQVFKTTVPEGYKQTEVGSIPEDWKVKPLGDLTVKVGSGMTPRGGHKVYQTHGRPFIRSQNVGWRTLLLDDVVYIDEATHSTFAESEIHDCDVLLNITGASIGRSAVADLRLTGGNVNQHVCIIRTIPQKLVPSFLNLFLISAGGQRQIDSFQAGGNRQGLNFRQVRSIRIPLPATEAEQRAIATALSDVDALLEGLDRLIAKKRDLKQAAMQQLITGQTRLPGFGGEWEVRRIGDLLVICHGKSQRGVEVEDGPYPILATGGQIGTSITPLYDEPSVLIGRKGTINKPLYMEKPFWTVDTLFYSIMKGSNSAKFWYYRFLMIDWMRYNEASGVPSLNAKTIENIEVACPSSEEQAAIAAVLSDMDAEIDALEQRRTKTVALKQAMMQELLTGRTRLV